MDSVRTGQVACLEDEEIDAETRLVDFVSLQLRLRRGLARSEFERRFGRSIEDVLGAELESFVREGVLEIDGNYLRVTRDWVFVTNEVLARLLAEI